MVAPVLLLVVILVAPVGAVAPVGSDKFNVRAQVDLAALTRDNFTTTLTSAAKSQSGLVFYDFADTLCELLAKESADFNMKTGIAVKHVCVDGDNATQHADFDGADTLVAQPPSVVRTLRRGPILACGRIG